MNVGQLVSILVGVILWCLVAFSLKPTVHPTMMLLLCLLLWHL